MPSQCTSNYTSIYLCVSYLMLTILKNNRELSPSLPFIFSFFFVHLVILFSVFIKNIVVRAKQAYTNIISCCASSLTNTLVLSEGSYYNPSVALRIYKIGCETGVAQQQTLIAQLLLAESRIYYCSQSVQVFVFCVFCTWQKKKKPVNLENIIYIFQHLVFFLAT